MKATLDFDLNTEDDAIQYKRAVHADEAFDLLWDIDQELGELLKRNDNIRYDDVKIIKDMIYETKLMGMYL